MSVSADISSPAGLADRPATLLNRAERLILGLRLALALAALCLLIVAGGIDYLIPAQRGIAELVAGAAATLVAVPVFVEAWQSLRHPSLHGITDRLVALALIAAWATGDLMTAAFLPIIMTIGHVLEERSMLGSHEAVRALSKLTEVDTRRHAARRIDGDRAQRTLARRVTSSSCAPASVFRPTVWYGVARRAWTWPRSPVSPCPSRSAKATRSWPAR